jgi:AAA+ ATPase superfamily predicted ATPase
MKIIGRKYEVQELLDCFNSNQAEFIVVYGRRRVGKTFLIENAYEKKKCLFFHASGIQDGDIKTQLGEFAKSMSEAFYNGVSIASANSWMNAFDALTKSIEGMQKKLKVVLFFDELPWMATKRSKVLQALDYYWNRVWSKNSRIKLIVCGSSASWIIKNIINNQGGLHNRYTKSLLLKPFTLHETKMFLENNKINFSDKQILQLYTVMGGIPHYLKQIKKNMSAMQNINHLCFYENGILFSEFDKLFKSLFRNAKKYMELIRIIAKVREGVSREEIEKQSILSKKGGSLTDRLNDLELAGFIKSFLPLGHIKWGEYYRVIDEYSCFYLKWIEPEKHTLIGQEVGNGFWMKKAGTPTYFNWLGYAFEAVCYKHISQIREALNIDAGTRVGAWRYTPRKETVEQGAQIDLLFERDDDAVTLFEIKCTEKPFELNKEYYEKLLNKIKIYNNVTRNKRQIFVVLISASGIKKTKYSDEIIDGVVTLENLMKK